MTPKMVGIVQEIGIFFGSTIVKIKGMDQYLMIFLDNKNQDIIFI